ncbi:MAG: helix-turn-helix domain-containing protein [Armatimonadota bacterium]
MLTQTLSVKEAAFYLHVQPRTVRAWILSGKLRASRAGKSYIIPEPEVEKMLTTEKPATSRLDTMTREECISELVEHMCCSIHADDVLKERRERHNKRQLQLER